MAPKFEMSPEASKILTMLSPPHPKSITYKEAQNLTGVNDIARLRGYIRTALRHAFRKWQVVYAVERGVGYMLLDESQKNDLVGTRIGKVRLGVRRIKTIHDAVSFNALDALGKLTHVVNATQLSEMKKSASKGRRNKIAKAANESGTVTAAIDGTLELFRKKSV